MIRVIRALTVLLFIISSSLSVAEIKKRPGLLAAPEKLIFCHEDQNAFPWVFAKDGKNQGLDISLLELVSDKLAIPIEFASLPWKRCLREVQDHKIHGAIAASFKAERLNMGRYPVTPKGNLDANRRLHTSSYSLYIPKTSDLGWNGETFINLDGLITIQSGFSIGDLLKKIDVDVIEFTNPVDNLRIVIEGRAAGAALHTDRVDSILMQQPKLAKKIKKYQVPILTKPYYVLLSFQLVREYPELSETIWDTIAEVRDSTEMAEIRNQFFKEN